MFHSFHMTRSRLCTDLEEALMFQKFFAQSVCFALDARFCDNDLISCFKILNPTNMPSGQVGLQMVCFKIRYFVVPLWSRPLTWKLQASSSCQPNRM
jgi:hypothetical protein